MPKKKSRKSKVKELDELVKKIVRKRDENRCQWCGKYVTGSNCHVSHVIPRSKGYALRWDLQNLKVLCYHCHINVWHKNPIEASAWFDYEFPYRADYLRMHKEDIIPSRQREEFMEKKLFELTDIWLKIKDGEYVLEDI